MFLIVVHNLELLSNLEGFSAEQFVFLAIASKVPDAEVAGNAVHAHFLICEAVVAQLLKVFVNSLLNDGLALVALQVLYFDNVHHFVLLVCNHNIRLDTLTELLNGLFAVNLQIPSLELKLGARLPQLLRRKLLDQGVVQHLHRKQANFPLEVECIFDTSEHFNEVVDFVHQLVHVHLFQSVIDQNSIETSILRLAITDHHRLFADRRSVASR